MSGRTTSLLAILALEALAAVRPRAARGQPCPAVTVEVDAAVRARWPELAERLRGALQGREDVDACARVDLTMRGGAALLIVSLPDGRSAARPVSDPEDAVSLLKALLLVPAVPEAAEPIAEEQPRPTAVVPVARSMVAAPIVAAAAPPVPNPLRFELSLVTGARVGGAQASVGLGLLAQVELARWLIGFMGRADGYQPLSGGTMLPALELALLGGRRIRFSSASLDASAGLAVVNPGVNTVEMRAPDGQVVRHSTSSALPRALLSVRLTFAAQRTLRPFVGLDGEVGRNGVRGDPLAADSHLPLATIGLSVGATLGAP